MDTSRIEAIKEQADGFISKMKDIQNKYISKINGNLSEIEKLINNAENHSKSFIDDKIKQLNKRNEQLLAGFNSKIEELTSSITAWYEKAVNNIAVNIVELEQTKLGIELPEAAIKAAASAIPIPPLPKPELKIELPKIEIKPGEITSIPKIPTM